MYIASGCIGEDEAEAGKELWENENPNRSITFSEIAVSLNIVRRGEKKTRKNQTIFFIKKLRLFFFLTYFYYFPFAPFYLFTFIDGEGSLCILCDVIRHQDETRSLFSIGYP